MLRFRKTALKIIEEFLSPRSVVRSSFLTSILKQAKKGRIMIKLKILLPSKLDESGTEAIIWNEADSTQKS
jgi:hypothetical protein